MKLTGIKEKCPRSTKSVTLQKELFHANLVLASKMRPDFQK